MDVQVVPRAEFLSAANGVGWQYSAGEHVTFIGYTQSGKTTLAYQLLEVTTSPKLPAVVLVMKPRDATPEKWSKRLRYKKVRSWPPPSASRYTPMKPPGWTLWPKMGDIHKDDSNLTRQFSSALTESYRSTAKKGGQNRIIFADEVVGVTKELGLGPELDAIWMRGSSMGLGLWAATQRPFHAPLHAYNAPVHIFLHRDPDLRNMQRYQEIGGVDSRLVRSIVSQLQLHQFLYIRRTDYTMCVVDR